MALLYTDKLQLGDLKIRCYENAIKNPNFNLQNNYDEICKDLSVTVALVMEAYAAASKAKPLLIVGDFVQLYYAIALYSLKEVRENPSRSLLFGLHVKCVRNLLTLVKVFESDRTTVDETFTLIASANVLQLLYRYADTFPNLFADENKNICTWCESLEKKLSPGKTAKNIQRMKEAVNLKGFEIGRWVTSYLDYLNALVSEHIG